MNGAVLQSVVVDKLSEEDANNDGDNHMPPSSSAGPTPQPAAGITRQKFGLS